MSRLSALAESKHHKDWDPSVSVWEAKVTAGSEWPLGHWHLCGEFPRLHRRETVKKRDDCECGNSQRSVY